MICFFEDFSFFFFFTTVTPAGWAFHSFIFREDFFARRGAEPCLFRDASTDPSSVISIGRARVIVIESRVGSSLLCRTIFNLVLSARATSLEARVSPLR